MMQGSIEVRSVQGEGTSFYVSLPLKGAEAPVDEGDASIGEEHSFDGVRLLLVEDNEMNREISETILSQQGFIIDTAEDGQVAVDKFTAAPAGTYKAILMDVQMPVLDGYGATQAIRRSSHPEAATIPIIAVTADVFTDDVARVMACGMNDYLSKPIDFHKLIVKLKKYT
jgi:CheY-like chemotaxis protein